MRRRRRRKKKKEEEKAREIGGESESGFVIVDMITIVGPTLQKVLVAEDGWCYGVRLALAQQIISAIKVTLGEDGSNRGAKKIARIRENSNFFRSELKKMGFEVRGDNDAPVMSIMLYNPAKLPAFSRECLNQNVAVSTVSYPATPLLEGRARICISASHSKEDLIKGLQVISRVGDLVGVKYFPAEPIKQQQDKKTKKSD